MARGRSSILLALFLLLASVPALLAQGIVTCSSNDGRRHFCNIGHYDNARLVNQRSGSPCIRGETWGVQRGSIWVDRGCRADFQPMRAMSPDRGRHRSAVIRCSSNNGGHVVCPTGREIARAMLERQISGSACVENRTWGFSRRSIWVDRGCRADIRVFYR